MHSATVMLGTCVTYLVIQVPGLKWASDKPDDTEVALEVMV